MGEVDLGPCRGLLREGERGRCVVLLPGARYPTRAPLLWFARAVAAQRGWSTLEVLDQARPNMAPGQWALDRAERALAAAPGDDPVVIAKSLTSIATGLAADRALAAAWLTPLLGEAAVVDGLARASAPALLVGGSADPTWQPAALPQNPMLELEEVEGADHGLELPGDVQRSLDALRTVTARIGAFLDRL